MTSTPCPSRTQSRSRHDFHCLPIHPLQQLQVELRHEHDEELEREQDGEQDGEQDHQLERQKEQ